MGRWQSSCRRRSVFGCRVSSGSCRSPLSRPLECVEEAGCRVRGEVFFGWLFLQVERKRQESKGFWREAEGGVEKGVSIREIAERDWGRTNQRVRAFEREQRARGRYLERGGAFWGSAGGILEAERRLRRDFSRDWLLKISIFRYFQCGFPLASTGILFCSVSADFWMIFVAWGEYIHILLMGFCWSLVCFVMISSWDILYLCFTSYLMLIWSHPPNIWVHGPIDEMRLILGSFDSHYFDALFFFMLAPLLSTLCSRWLFVLRRESTLLLRSWETLRRVRFICEHLVRLRRPKQRMNEWRFWMMWETVESVLRLVFPNQGG